MQGRSPKTLWPPVPHQCRAAVSFQALSPELKPNDAEDREQQQDDNQDREVVHSPPRPAFFLLLLGSRRTRTSLGDGHRQKKTPLGSSRAGEVVALILMAGARTIGLGGAFDGARITKPV
jgi:hypothetical protein